MLKGILHLIKARDAPREIKPQTKTKLSLNDWLRETKYCAMAANCTVELKISTPGLSALCLLQLFASSHLGDICVDYASSSLLDFASFWS